jgi:lipid II:glycine glycyltransferase (peptidoglycan interpeptide bridge formation enzyme)
MKQGRTPVSMGNPASANLSIKLSEIFPSSAGNDIGFEEGASFMQSLFWARFKAGTGWRSFICAIECGPENYRSTLVLMVRRLGMGFSFAYVPHGPGALPESMEPGVFLEALSEKASALIGGKLLFIRFDLPWETEEKRARMLLDSISRGKGRLERGLAVQVPDTTILDLERTEEELLSGMKPKWRYNIRLAEKKNVEVGREGAEALDIFYRLYGETAKRDGIAIHPLSYYKALLGTAEEFGGKTGTETRTSMSVWVARHEGLPVASIITLFHNRHATYLYGASSSEKRNLMPAYALQWNAIRAAKREGCLDYDFFGIPPDDDPRHAMAGLYLFKTGFGGAVIHRLGSVDYPVAPVAYAVFRQAEALRLFWHKTVKKRIKTMVQTVRKTRRK